MMKAISTESIKLREPYRALFKYGRTYASFERRTVLPLIEDLKSYPMIADPMAGFGGLMNLCSEYGLSTINIEYNPASYLWMVANNPENSQVVTTVLQRIEKYKFNFNKAAEISKNWFPDDSIAIIVDLYQAILNETKKYSNKESVEKISLAILLPFVGRLATCVEGNSVTHVKKGGICVYKDIERDFLCYLSILKHKIASIPNHAKNKHFVLFGDLKKVEIQNKISAFITSPPYPNGRDYDRMFAPENKCISILESKKIIEAFQINDPLISSPIISKYKYDITEKYNNLASKSAIKFIDYIGNYKASPREEYDNKIYYAPYFINYFYQLQKAYENFARFLDINVDGYIVAVNNTARKKIIPVAESIVEVFIDIGLEANICDDFTRELSHFGTINPRVKGFKARHTEYVVKVRRRIK